MTDFLRQWAKYAGLLFGGLLLVLAMGAVACGDDDDATTEETEEAGGDDATEEPTEDVGEPTEEGGAASEFDYGSLSGAISIDGSSTVFPITQAVAEEFAGVADVDVDVGIAGTSAGFERFCAGEIQISDASRPISDEEIAACADAGIDDIVEIQVGIDALTVVVNPDNTMECVTIEQLAQLFMEGGASNFSEVDPSFPHEDIIFYYPGADSGTFDYFVEEVLGDPDEGAPAHRSDGTASEDDNVLALGVEEDSAAIGYFGFAYFQGAGDSLKALQLDAGSGCVEPSIDTALAGDYFLSRPLFIYTRESFLTENPEVLGFVNFYLENAEALVTEVGYIPLPADVLAEEVAEIEPFLP
ncbi:MAG: PstS family phosphate ABC transporter substrate-binding protein [Dehalococcoidia bacterium]